jgi:hypothetical protein
LGPRALTPSQRTRGGGRLRTRLAWLTAAAVAACAPARSANVPPTPAPSSTAGAPAASAATPEPPLDLEAGEALGRQPEEGEILVRTTVLRGHPIGVHVGFLFGMWQGWRSTFRALARDPVADFDWVDVVGPSDPAKGRMLARVAEGAPDAALDGRMVALQARSAEPAASHVDGRVPAAAARLDGVLRVVFRPEPHFVAATAVANGPALSRLLARARVRLPESAPLEAVRLDVPHPHDAVRLLPASIRRIRARILALANGDAEGTGEGDCESADEAARTAAALRDTVARLNSPMVRMLTHGLLDGIAIASDGPLVKIHVHATRDQLETVLSVMAAITPGDGAP